MADILIVVGTESGNSQMVADLLRAELGRLGHAVDLANAGEHGAARLAERDIVLICTATHGDGELPDNIIPFADSLRRDRPDLSRLRYGVIALGDQTYKDTFCNGGKTMDALFAELGARKVGERLEIDACTQPLPDEEALEWAKDWVGQLS
ncbi:MAG: flavodoxin/nitric oxide synthase [Alphaproteobacteria bacterium]|nr:flavodoxin/nitric oxide synthase [Alphaproteobacteria bacterium]